MVYKFKHGPFTPFNPPQLFSLFFQCLGSHYDHCLSGIACAFIVTFFFSSGIVISIKMKRYENKQILFSPVFLKH